MSGSFYGYHAFMHQNQRTRVTRTAELAILMLNYRIWMAHFAFLLFHQHHQILSHSGYLLFENFSQKNGIFDEWFFTMDIMHLKDPLALCGLYGSALSLFISLFHMELICFFIVLQQ